MDRLGFHRLRSCRGRANKKRRRAGTGEDRSAEETKSPLFLIPSDGMRQRNEKRKKRDDVNLMRSIHDHYADGLMMIVFIPVGHRLRRAVELLVFKRIFCAP